MTRDLADSMSQEIATTDQPGPNSRAVLEQRARTGQLTFIGPLLMVFARLVLAFLMQAVVAALYTWRAHPDPWLAAAPWFTVTGTLVDLGSLALLTRLTRREGIRLVDLLGLEPRQIPRDLLRAAGIALVFLVVGIACGAASSILLYGSSPPPRIMGPLPLWAALYSLLVWPVIWGAVEQMTYNGYAAPRLQALTGKTWLAVLITCIGYGLQHIALPALPDVRFMLYRFLPAFGIGVVMILLYLRSRRLLPFIVAHWLVDALSALTQVLLPLLAS